MCDLSAVIKCKHQENHKWCSFAVAEAVITHYKQKKGDTSCIPSQDQMKAFWDFSDEMAVSQSDSAMVAKKSPPNVLGMYGFETRTFDQNSKDWNQKEVLEKLHYCLNKRNPVMAGICLSGGQKFTSKTGKKVSFFHAILIVGVSRTKKIIKFLDPAGKSEHRRCRDVGITEFMGGYDYCLATDFGPKTGALIDVTKIKGPVRVKLYRLDWIYKFSGRIV